MSLVEQWKNEDLGAANTGGAMPRAALEAANDMDGQKALRLTRLAQDLGLPEGLVAENPQRAELDATARRIEKNPLFAEWASEDRLNAALARDDTEAMGGVFDRVSQVWTRESEALGQAWERGKGQLDIADLGNRILDSEEGYALLPEIEKAQKAANPLYEQESFGIVQPGTLSSTPHVVNVDGRGVLLPSLDENNAPLNREQALERFQQGGQHAGVFSSPQAAMLFLSQPVARQQELYAGFKQKTGESWVESALGPGTAVEQLPRMLFRQFPMAAESAAWGAAGGFATGVGSALVLGQAGPQAAIPEEIFTIPAAGIAGFGLGGKAAWSLGTAKSAYWAERGSFAIELAQMRDANGERLPVEVVRNASNIYGFLAAAEEGLFEYAFLSLLKPLGMSGAAEELGRQGTKTFLRSAIKRAAADRSVGMGLLDMGARLGLNSILEGMEEGVQETTAALVEYLALGYGNQFDGKNFVGNELFTAENATRIGEAFTGGAVAGFWLGSGPIVLSGAVDIQSAREAAAFADRHLSTYEKVEAANTKQLSPQHMQSALEAAGPAMRERVDLPADAALELYQGGIDVLSPLGITEQQAEAAAGQGQAFTVPVSRMHAFMDRQQFEAASQIMRRTPEAMSLAESARLDERVASDAQKIVELYQQQAEEFDLMTQEKERVRQWAREAVGSVPGLKAQAESLGGGVDAYVDDWLNVAERFAARMSTAGQSPVDTFRRFITRSLERGNQLSDSTVDEFYNSIFGEGSGTAAYEQGMEAEARGAANAESVLGKVRGRLDGRSLKRDYPDAYREIARVHGPGIFRSAEKGGLPLDYLAAELVESNAFQEGMGADELLEYLKRPHRERRLFQPLNPGVDLDAPVSVVRVTPQFEGKNPLVLRKRFPKALKDKVLAEFGRGVTNEDTGLVVGMTGNDFREHLKIAQPDTALAHLEAIAALPDLMRNARLIESHEDRKPSQGSDVKRIHRFISAFGLGESNYSVLLTVKERADGTAALDTKNPVTLYHHRIAKSLSSSDTGHSPAMPATTYPGRDVEQSPPGSSADINNYSVRELVQNVNDNEGRRYFQQRAEGARGSVTIRPEGYIIELFRGADLSTLFHESAHIFYEEISLFVREGLADESMIRDFEALKGWFSRFDDDAALREEYERSVRGTPLFAGRGFGTLNEAEKAQAREIAEKEYFARGFEAYLLEGKAPSPELRSVFARFKEWLRKVYDAARDLNVELTDEVRGVFDRMIATEREIAAVAARNELLDLTRTELDALGITGPARQYARTLMGAARKAAAQKLEEDRNKDRKRRLAQYTKDAREELLKLPAYAARAEIRKTPLDTAAVAELYGEEAARALRKTMPFGMKEGGADPEILAAEQGFASGATMVSQIIESPSLGRAVQALVKEKDARHDAEYGAAEYLLDTDQANEQVAMVGRYLAQSLGREHLQQEAFARVAEQELAAMPMGRAVQTGNFLAAMRRALRQERQAISRGDFAAALEANHKARLNMEFARRSRNISAAQDALQRTVKRFVGMAKGDMNARFIVMDIGMRHGLSKFNERLGEGRDVRTIQKWMNEAEAGGYTLFADERILYGPGTPWREMPLADFEGLADTIKQIVTVERNQRQIATKQGKADLNEVAAGIAASIYAQRNSTAAKTVETQPAALKSLKGLHAIHMKVEAICIALDGDTRGPTWEAVYLPIAQADDAQSMRFREVRDALKSSDLFGRYTRKELAGMGGKKELVKEIGESLTWENRIALALNMGNETNVSRIRDGHNWSDEQIAAVLRPLTRRDWEFVQSVWDYIGSFKEESFALQEEISGMRPVSVEARPFTVQTADGAILNMRGGYYPIKYNSDKGFRAFMQEQKVMDKELFGGRNYGAAMTKTGHLKDRSEGGMGSPLLLELPVITDHIFNTVHDITHRKAVLDVAKVIKHKAVSQAIENTVGQEIYRELMPWLQDVANERQEPMHAVHRWARWARAGSSIMQMGYKVTTMLAQPLGFTQSVHLLGYKWAGKGLKLVYGSPLNMPELLEETFARSAFMANRIKSFDREVRDIAKQLKPGMGRFAWVDKVKENAFVPMGYFQMGVDLPTWWGAFAKGVGDFKGDEVRAAEYADSIVRMSQGSGSTKDLARVQRGGDLLRLTTMFYSYFNTLYNLGARGITALKNDHSPAGIFQAANTALLLWFIPAVLSEVFAGRGPDEDEEPGEWALMNILQYPFQAVVGVRDLTNAIFGEYGYQITPAQAAPKSLVNWFKAVNKAMEEEDAGKLVKPTAEAAGYLFGLPMKQPIITVGNLWDYITGEDPELHARDLFFVKPKSRR